MMISTCKGQTLLEYTVVVGLVLLILVTMSPLMKRTIQGMVKGVADQIGNQKDSDQDFNSERGGVMENSYTTMRSQMIEDTRQVNSTTIYGYDSTMDTAMNSATNLGFSK
jgi:uncharacterized protein (UPF0333 family)